MDVFPEALESPEVFFPTLDADAERTCAGDVAGRWADACAKRGAVDDALTRRRHDAFDDGPLVDMADVLRETNATALQTERVPFHRKTVHKDEARQLLYAVHFFVVPVLVLLVTCLRGWPGADG